MRLDHPIQIIDYDDLRTVLDAAVSLAKIPTLITPPEAAWYAGPLFWQTMIDEARDDYPGLAFRLIADCGDDAGTVMKALSFGLQYLRFGGEAAVAQQLGQMAAYSEAFLVTIGGEVLELSLHEDKAAACRDWLARYGTAAG